MRIFLLLMGLALCAGCKRGAKDTGPARDDLANVKLQQQQPAPAKVGAEKSDKAGTQDEPNWLKDERVQPKKDQLPAEGPASGGKQPWNVGPPAGGFEPPVVPGAQPMMPPAAQPNPVAGPPAGAKPPAAAVQPQPAAGGNDPGANRPPAIAPAGNSPVGAAKRVVAMADMRDLQIFIDTASGASGKMPSGAEVMAALIEAKSPVAELVKEGAVILTGAKERESVWAFEARAYLDGGLVVTQNGVEKVTAGELKKLLGK